ncbi:MAG: fused MFS/spermidine synthase [Polyangiaceae bacterium]
MNAPTATDPKARKLEPRTLLHLAVLSGGAAALSWEVIWQLQVALALGVSAEGTAITLACTMGGMTLGSLGMGHLLHGRAIARPLRGYGLLELTIGLSGLLLRPAMALVQHADSAAPADAATSPIHLIGILLVLGLPTLAMGASLPLFGMVAAQYRTKVSVLYGLNTMGAAAGTLLLAFVLLPSLGVGASILVTASINVGICAVAWLLPKPSDAHEEGASAVAEAASPTIRGASLALPVAGLVVFVTGFVTFGLEVAWFRALRAVYLSTTSTFAILLASVLLPLALASRFAAQLRARARPVGPYLAAGAIAVLLATPLIERFESIRDVYRLFVSPSWFLQTLLVIGPPMFCLGIALPWVLDDQQSTRRWGMLYAVNTLGAIAGALGAAWWLLPAFGFARTAWIMGGLAMLASFALLRRRDLLIAAGLGAAALVLAVHFESGIGRTRTIGSNGELLAFRESPDFTVSVAKTDGVQQLYIDGFVATSQAIQADYMVWMGRLPMLLHPDPKNALVICFGTGQTSNAVRREGIASLDIVDISQAVFDMAPYFPKNEAVLNDPRVTHHRSDGRTWLRRASTNPKLYDVITLEPMPPTFAGVNALYSREFYQLMLSRLNPGGIAAQWLPFHLVDVYRATSIAATFRESFPDSILWVHPQSGTGILLGRKPGGASAALGSSWPGLAREAPGRTLSPDEIRHGVLDNAGLARLSAPGTIVTDDNELLAYGFSPTDNYRESSDANATRGFVLVAQARAGSVTLPETPFDYRSWILATVLVLLVGRIGWKVRNDYFVDAAA